jgi:flagellar FliL protein
MAKDAKPEAEGAAVAPKKGKKLVIVIVAALVMVLALGGGGFMVWKKMHPADEEDEVEVAADKPKTEKKKGAKEVGPIYIALDQFTVNLAPDNGDQFLQVMISVEVEDMTVGDRLKSYTPKMRNNVMLLLSGKKASELITKAGKEALANEIRNLINEVLDPGAKPGYGPVKEVLFTSFIIQ